MNNTSQAQPVKSFGSDADQFLRDFYEAVGADTTQHKIRALELKLAIESNFYAVGGTITDEMKLGCLEYDFLEKEGVIKLELV